MGLEGIVGKRDGSLYTGERDGTWIKLKCWNRAEFVIVGLTRSAAGISSLLLGVHDDDGRLVYAGRVSSGIDRISALILSASLVHLPREGSALCNPPQLGRNVVWLEPLQVCEVQFAEFTPAGKVRHPVFIGLRDDKPAAGISLETDTDLP